MNKIIPAPGKENNYVSLERLTFLVDGIFAITITLLVLDLRLPETNNLDLLQGLRDMLPRLFIYFIAFYSIASHWIIHQRLFRYITGVDATMIWLMMLELLFITLIPVSTAIVGRFPTAGLALGLFSANGFLHAITNCIFCAYAARNQKQFAVHTDPRVLAIHSQVWLLISGGFLLSIPLGYLNAYIAAASWILLPALAVAWGSSRRGLLTPKTS